MSRQPCEARSRLGLRCRKLARVDYATCIWHADREHLYAPFGPPGSSVDVQCWPSLEEAPAGVRSRIETDARFRKIVGLPQVSYRLVELAKGVVDVLATHTEIGAR